MSHNPSTPIKSNEHLLKLVFAPYRLEDCKQQIIQFKNPFHPPYGEFFSLAKEQFIKLPKSKQFLIGLLQDTHLEYWKCPTELCRKMYSISNSYCLTAYYTDIIMEDLLCLTSEVTLYKSVYINQNEAQLFFSISLPNVYFDKVYEITEKHIKHEGTSYIIRTFQPGLFLLKNSSSF